MCTAIHTCGARPLFGRTLDLERSYDQAVIATPQNFKWRFLHAGETTPRYALLGTASLWQGMPLYFDAVNHAGLAMAGLNFPAYACYRPSVAGAINLASFELIPYLLSQCSSVREATALLHRINITPDSVSADLPATPLHWMLADAQASLVIEPREDGLHLHDNPYGVLTNSPPFPYHTAHLAAFAALSAAPPENRLCPDAPLAFFSRGMGACGLPGDFSSASRFVRAVFAKSHTLPAEQSMEVDRFFHIMDTVAVPRGCILTEESQAVQTVYTCCYDLADAAYYYTTYDCRRIRAVHLRHLPAGREGVTVFSMAGEG